MVTGLEIAAFAAVLGGTGYSIYQADQAQIAGKKQAAAQQRQQQLASTRSRRQALRQAQMQRYQTLVASQELGAAGGSGVAGGLTGLQSQLGSSLGYSGMQGQLSGQISSFGVQQQVAMSRAQTGSAVAGLGMQTLSMTGLPQGNIGNSRAFDPLFGGKGLGGFS